MYIGKIENIILVTVLVIMNMNIEIFVMKTFI